jgi:hypothetical protein
MTISERKKISNEIFDANVVKANEIVAMANGSAKVKEQASEQLMALQSALSVWVESHQDYKIPTMQ